MSRKKGIIITVVVVLAAVVVVIAGYLCMPKKLNSLYAGKETEITNMTITLGGTGEIVVTNDQDKIVRFAEDLGDYKVNRDYFAKSRTGWSYMITLYWGEKSLSITCTGTDRIKIDNKEYRITGANKSSIESMIGEAYDDLSEK